MFNKSPNIMSNKPFTSLNIISIILISITFVSVIYNITNKFNYELFVSSIVEYKSLYLANVLVLSMLSASVIFILYIIKFLENQKKDTKNYHNLLRSLIYLVFISLFISLYPSSSLISIFKIKLLGYLSIFFLSVAVLYFIYCSFKVLSRN